MEKRILSSVLISLSVVLVAAAFIPISNSVIPSAKAETLSFLTNVVSIDLSKYNTTLVSDQKPLDVVNAENQEEVRYLLNTTSGSSLDVTCLFNNGTIAWCTIYAHNGAPVYSNMRSIDTLSQANAILSKYQAFTGSSRFQAMSDLLAKATIVGGNASLEMGAMKLMVISEGSTQQYIWTQTYDGITGPAFSLEFVNGSLETFNDQQSLFSIGQFALNISKDQAIKIALDRAKNFSWAVGSDLSTATVVTNFTILTSPVQSQLTLQPRENSTLYPYWRVDLYLDKVYDGCVNDLAVGIWADSGNIEYIRALGFGGIPAGDEQTRSGISPNALSIVIVVAIAAALTIAVIIRKKLR
jgi:hypothetical protein